MFVFGLLFLLIGYTQPFISLLIFNKPSRYTPLLIIPQFLGSALGVYVIGKLTSHINIKWLFFSSFLIASITLFIIAFLDKIAVNFIARIVAYEILTFIFGFMVFPILTLILLYIGAIFQDDKSKTWISYIMIAKGLGAGLFPAIAAGFIVNLTSHASIASFNAGRWFYIMPAIITLIVAIASLECDYFHSKQLTSIDVIKKQKVAEQAFATKQSGWLLRSLIAKIKNLLKKPILKPLCLLCFLIFVMAFVENSVNFNFINLAKRSTAVINKKELLINAIRAVGIYALINSVWRFISGKWILPKVHFVVFITVSLLICTIGWIAILVGFMDRIWGIYLEAAIFGIGVGNLHPSVYSYGINLEPKRSTFIGRFLCLGQIVGLLFNQVLVGSVWLVSFQSPHNSVLYLLPAIILLIVTVLLGSAFVMTYRYIRHKKKVLALEHEA